MFEFLLFAATVWPAVLLISMCIVAVWCVFAGFIWMLGGKRLVRREWVATLAACFVALLWAAMDAITDACELFVTARALSSLRARYGD